MTEAVEVKVGQVWADCDWRAAKYGRQVKVVNVHRPLNLGGRGFAFVVSRNGSGPWGKRVTQIRLDRFRPGSTGYRLVHDGEYVQ